MPFDQWDAVQDDARDVRKPTGSASDDATDTDGADAASANKPPSSDAKTRDGDAPSRSTVTASGTASTKSAPTSNDDTASKQPEREDTGKKPVDVTPSGVQRSRLNDVERGLLDELVHDIEMRIDALGERLLGRIDAAVDDMEHRIDDALGELDAAYARVDTRDADAEATRLPSLDIATRVAAMTTDEALALATDHPGDVALLNRIYETMEAVSAEYLGKATAWTALRDRFLDAPHLAGDVFEASDAVVPTTVRDNVMQVLGMYARIAPDVRAAHAYLRTHEPDLNLDMLGALDLDWMASAPVRVAASAPAGASS